MSRASIIVVAILAAGAAHAAQLPGIPGAGGLGGIPNVSGMGVGNVAGVLSYCAKNKLLGGSSGTGASSALTALTKKPGVTSSTGFAAGQAGQILSGKGPALSLDTLAGPMKSQACGMVFKQAQKLL